MLLNCCTIDLLYFTSPSNVSSFESKYRWNHKTHLLSKYLIVIGQGLYHARFWSSLCSSGLPAANWRKSWLQSHFAGRWWSAVDLKGIIDIIDPAEGAEFTSKIIVLFSNTNPNSLPLEAKTEQTFSGTDYRACLQRAGYANLC